MRPPRSNAWRPQLVAMNCLDPPAAASAKSRTDRTDTSHAPASAYPPPFPPLHPQLANSPHELLAHLLETGLLHWREIARFQQMRSEEHTSELQSRLHLVCRLLLEKKKRKRLITAATVW